jgi:hypothetical protein
MWLVLVWCSSSIGEERCPCAVLCRSVLRWERGCLPDVPCLVVWWTCACAVLTRLSWGLSWVLRRALHVALSLTLLQGFLLQGLISLCWSGL